MNKQCIGIVGGLGPYAGLDLARKIFDHTIADHDQDHIPLMLYSFPGDIPERPEFLLGLTDVNPGPAIGEIMGAMAKAGATIIGMACNTAHHPLILNAALQSLKNTNARFIHMIESAVNYMRCLYPAGSRIGLLCTEATLRTGLYQNALINAGLIPVILDEQGRGQVQEAISNREYGIKACCNPVSNKAREILLKSARDLARKNIEALLLGCTEIPLALTETTLFNIPVADATSILAMELIRAYDSAKAMAMPGNSRA